MAVENAARFEELLRGDEELQARLKAAMETFNGGAADDRAAFEATILPLAQEAGLPFTYDEALAYMASGRDLSDAELEAVAGGGDSACYVIGISDGEDTWACTTWDNGAGACDYIGISLLENNF